MSDFLKLFISVFYYTWTTQYTRGYSDIAFNFEISIIVKENGRSFILFPIHKSESNEVFL